MDEKLRCHICGNIGDEGIILLNKYICRECESDLARVPIYELKYEKFRRGIKDIWKSFNKRYNNKNILRYN